MKGQVKLARGRRIAVRQPSLLQQPALGQLVRQSMLSPGGGPGAMLQPGQGSEVPSSVESPRWRRFLPL